MLAETHIHILLEVKRECQLLRWAPRSYLPRPLLEFPSVFSKARSFLTASHIPFGGSLCGPQALTSGPRSRPLRSDVVSCLGDVNFLE